MDKVTNMDALHALGFEASSVKVKIQKMHDWAVIPTYAHPTDTGMDLVTPVELRFVGRIANITNTEWCDPNCLDLSQRRVRIPLGFRVQAPPGWGFTVRPKSGKSLEGLSVELGTVDNGYTGELAVVVWAHEEVTIPAGKAFAQLVLERVPRCEWVETDEFEETVRGAGGFGSTGR